MSDQNAALKLGDKDLISISFYNKIFDELIPNEIPAT